MFFTNFLFTFIFILNSQILQANEVKYILGQVTINNLAASKGAFFKENDLIQVAAKSLAILELNDGSKIKINENSELKIINAVGNEPNSAQITSGSAFFKIKKILGEKLGTNKFKVRTNQVSFGVRGTEFFVSYGKNKTEDVWMCVNEGLVEAVSSKNNFFVKEGEGIQVQKELISTPTPLQWTKKLNWEMNENKSDLLNKVSIEEAYSNPMEKDYD